MNMDMHKQAFKEEAYELLAELETSLLEWEEKPDEKEVIGRIFRAMHTIKGSSAMFGFEDISEFTHEIETVLDLVRGDKMKTTPMLVDLTLSARDHIQKMVEADDTGSPVDMSETAQIALSFHNILKAAREPEEHPFMPTHPELKKGIEIKAEPIAAPSESDVTYRIRFKPDKNIFRKGTDPVLLLNELRELGESLVIAHTKNIPELGEYEPDICYVYWDIILTTSKGINAIKDIFIFVEDESDIKIEIIADEGVLDAEDQYKKLGEILIDRGDVSSEFIYEMLEKQKPIGKLLVEAGVVSSDNVESALMEQQHVKQIREKRIKEATVSSVRVPSNRLDKLVDLVGEMVTVQARLSQLAILKNDSELISVSESVERLTAELRDNTMSIRMLPIGTIFSKFKRVVRDLSRDLKKDVDLTTEGEETELDKTVIERLNDPLVHLIRNSVDHGIEPPEVRKKLGKPKVGVIRLSAEHSGASVYIRIKDDGAGMDPENLKRKAREKGLLANDQDVSDEEAFQYIFAPGFSTSQEVTSVSGRGVGMDVVNRNIRALKGSISVQSTKGEGTEILLKLPLTLAIIDGLLVKVAGDFYVIPLSIIEECVELSDGDIVKARGRKTITVRNELVPYIRLRDRFGITSKKPAIEQIVISNIDNYRIGLVVDRVIGNHQTVIKSLGAFYKNVADVSGATILGDGTVALILDVHKLTQAVESEFKAGV